MLTTIETIRAMQFAGNHAADAERFQQISDFGENPNNPMSERAEAFRIMAKRGMGLDGDHVRDDLKDEDFVNWVMLEG